MTDTPNPADFSTDEKPTEYNVTISVTGYVWVTINAENLEQAKDAAEKMADKMAEDVFEIDLDEVEDVRVDYVWQPPTMYRVTRDDQKMKVNILSPGDLPREPDERGF